MEKLREQMHPSGYYQMPYQDKAWHPAEVRLSAVLLPYSEWQMLPRSGEIHGTLL